MKTSNLPTKIVVSQKYDETNADYHFLVNLRFELFEKRDETSGDISALIQSHSQTNAAFTSCMQPKEQNYFQKQQLNLRITKKALNNYLEVKV